MPQRAWKNYTAKRKMEEPKVVTETKPKHPNMFHIVRFPPVKLYRDYLREWMSKRPKRDDEGIRRRMEEDRGRGG